TAGALPVINTAGDTSAATAASLRQSSRLSLRMVAGFCGVLLAVGSIIFATSPRSPKKPRTAPAASVGDQAAIKAKAEVVWERVRTVGRGETLGTLIDEGTVLPRTAETLRKAKQPTEASAAFKKLHALAERIEQADRERTEAAET